jgi:predicted anti-sigma-YlaC factor YlaD
MKCQDAEKYILLQSSGELPQAKENALAAHLHDCQSCQEFQFTLIESEVMFEDMQEEPSAKALQNVLREARINAPEQRKAQIFAWRPALAMAASFVIALGLFLGAVGPDKVGMELVVTDTQMLESSDQLASVMYDGISADDLAFNVLLTYEEG